MGGINYLFVFIGGALGSVLRFGVTQHTIVRWPQMVFPIGTFAVNVMGCFLITLFSVVLVREKPELTQPLRAFFMVGLLGGFTTFSSFSLETISLFYDGESLVAVSYILMSVVTCLLAAWFGIIVGNYV